MSGGVDSSVCAALLKERGFEVVGITMQIWQRALESQGCCSLSSIDDAKRVAHILDIPHYVLNFRDVFKEKIIRNFCEEYRKGRTPNPCIRCNKFVKFDALLRRARQISAEYVATGHYAKIVHSRSTQRYLLKKGVDTKKDQSYFLYSLTQRQLQRILMPLGGLTKQKVRVIARENKLPVAEKHESQEICFIPDNNYGAFIKNAFPQNVLPGPIVDKEGKLMGRHKGIIFYTVGQRKGLGIAYKEPLYVTAIDQKSNTVFVGTKNEVYSREFIADDVNLIDDGKINAPIRIKVKVRYLHPEAEAKVFPKSRRKVLVLFDRPQWAISPGQAAVFYKRTQVIGGGIIGKL